MAESIVLNRTVPLRAPANHESRFSVMAICMRLLLAESFLHAVIVGGEFNDCGNCSAVERCMLVFQQCYRDTDRSLSGGRTLEPMS